MSLELDIKNFEKLQEILKEETQAEFYKKLMDASKDKDLTSFYKRKYWEHSNNKQTKWESYVIDSAKSSID